jgi:lipoprotein-anchoring transpeptidase ErfK/SrfK
MPAPTKKTGGRSLAPFTGMRHVRSTAIILALTISGAAAGAQTSPTRTAQPAQEKPAPPNSSKQSAQIGDALALQVALDRAGFSPGEIDGRTGNNTGGALRAFQEANGLPTSGQPDPGTLEKLGDAYTNPYTTYAITAEDAAGPFVDNIPADMVEKAALPALGYTSIQELLAERFHTSPALLQKLNPNAGFAEGDMITVPNVEPFIMITPEPVSTTPAKSDVTRARNNTSANAGRGAVSRAADANAGKDFVVTVTDKTKTLTVADGTGKVVFYAPVTVGSTRDPLPVGEWKVNGVQRNPSFQYNPDLFWDADPGHSKAKLAPGPNNPVGTVWIDLSKEHYGIHGTPEPGRVGHTESHGCIRLTNWDVTRLAAMVAPGTKVILR